MADAVTAGSESVAFHQPPRQRRSKLSLPGWIVGTIVIVGMVIAVLLPSMCQSSETANKAKCASNLHQIGLAIALYAQNNNGQYPPSLAVLPGQEQISPAGLICPSSNDESAAADNSAGILAELTAAETNAAGHQHCLSYVYVGSKLNTGTVAAAAVVAYEPLDNHNGDGTNVLFGDGHAEWCDKKAWPNTAATAGVAVVQSLTTRR